MKLSLACGLTMKKKPSYLELLKIAQVAALEALRLKRRQPPTLICARVKEMCSAIRRDEISEALPSRIQAAHGEAMTGTLRACVMPPSSPQTRLFLLRDRYDSHDDLRCVLDISGAGRKHLLSAAHSSRHDSRRGRHGTLQPLKKH